MSKLFISAAHKSSGKTIVSIGLCAEFVARGLCVQAFKKGPDYIDPAWLARASSRPCFNLDFNTQSNQEIVALFADKHQAAEISLIEANKGLYDGVSLDGSDSNVALAKLLAAPVILVIDCAGITRGIAPLLRGYVEFDEAVNITGVILNRVSGARHRSKLLAAVEEYTDVKVFGSIDRCDDLILAERHLGLITSDECDKAEEKITKIRNTIAAQVDVSTILATVAPPQTKQTTFPSDSPTADIKEDDKEPQPKQATLPPVPAATNLRLGIFKDRAFSFYYPDDLEALEHCGAELVYINSLQDCTLPKVDGLFIGGGFPETQAPELEQNAPLRTAVREAIENGMPVYAECGGLMYLARSIILDDRHYQMCGVIAADIEMCHKPQGRGYVAFKETDAMPWQGVDTQRTYRAHEFHYSCLTNTDKWEQTALQILRGDGIGNAKDGIVYKNLLATYSHRRTTTADRWTERFVQFIKACKYNE